VSNIINIEPFQIAKQVEEENKRAMIRFEKAENNYYKIKEKEIERQLH